MTAAGVVRSQGSDRWRAALAIVPFLALGLADVLLLVLRGIDPLWGAAILPPIVFVTALGWITFETGFVEDRG
ncbi:MAG: hypothetical protein ABEJ81_09210 [Haloferacaceae archaeon]